MKRVDISGNVYGDLKVLHYTRTMKCGNSYLAQWMTECIHCGYQEERGGKNIKHQDRNVSCKVCSLPTKSSKVAKRTFRRGSKNISGAYFCSLRSGADRRGKDFTITIDYLQELLEKQDFKCALSGLSLVRDLDLPETENTGSVDRIDSSVGYVEGNVQWVLKDINNMKMNLTEDRLLELAKSLVQYSERDEYRDPLPYEDDPYWEE